MSTINIHAVENELIELLEMEDVSEHLRGRGGVMSLALLEGLLLERLGRRVGSNSVVSSPLLYPLFKRLKFKVEGVYLTHNEALMRYWSLVNEVIFAMEERPAHFFNRTTMSGKEGRLYKLILATGYGKYIFIYLGMVGNRDYLYWSDDRLIRKAGEYDGFSDLKNGECNLHRHIKGRELERDVVRAHPKYANHFYEGYEGYIYRSIAELVTGNFCVLYGVDFKYNVSLGVGLDGSNKAVYPDFLFPDKESFLELLQNVEKSRGARRVNYREKYEEKRVLYDELLLDVYEIDTDKYWSRGVFDLRGFFDELTFVLRKIGVVVPKVVDYSKLMYVNNEEKIMLLRSETSEVVSYLIEKKEISGIKILQDNYSYINNLLKIRDDYDEIRRLLMCNSSKIRSLATANRHAQNRLKRAA